MTKKLSVQLEIASKVVGNACFTTILHCDVLEIQKDGRTDHFALTEWPFLNGGNLVSLIKKGSQSKGHTCKVMKNVARGLDQMHDGTLGKVYHHRDVTPPNILLENEDTSRLTDFGISHRIDSVTTQLTRGRHTPGYCLHEHITKDTKNRDIFSFFVIYAELRLGRHPYPNPIEPLNEGKNKPDLRELGSLEEEYFLAEVFRTGGRSVSDRPLEESLEYLLKLSETSPLDDQSSEVENEKEASRASESSSKVAGASYGFDVQANSQSSRSEAVNYIRVEDVNVALPEEDDEEVIKPDGSQRSSRGDSETKSDDSDIPSKKSTLFEFKLPELGEGITQADILEVFVEEGGIVDKNSSFAEVGTDKATIHIPAPESGIVSKIFIKAGDGVQIGETIALILPERDVRPVEVELNESNDLCISSERIASDSHIEFKNTEDFLSDSEISGDAKSHIVTSGQSSSVQSSQYFSEDFDEPVESWLFIPALVIFWAGIRFSLCWNYWLIPGVILICVGLILGKSFINGGWSFILTGVLFISPLLFGLFGFQQVQFLMAPPRLPTKVENLMTLPGPAYGLIPKHLEAVSFSPDGDRITAAGEDVLVSWNAETGKRSGIKFLDSEYWANPSTLSGSTILIDKRYDVKEYENHIEYKTYVYEFDGLEAGFSTAKLEDALTGVTQKPSGEVIASSKDVILVRMSLVREDDQGRKFVASTSNASQKEWAVFDRKSKRLKYEFNENEIVDEAEFHRFEMKDHAISDNGRVLIANFARVDEAKSDAKCITGILVFDVRKKVQIGVLELGRFPYRARYFNWGNPETTPLYTYRKPDSGGSLALPLPLVDEGHPVLVSSDGSILAAISSRNELAIYDTKNLTKLISLTKLDKPKNWTLCDFSQDSKALLVGNKNMVNVIDVETGSILFEKECCCVNATFGGASGEFIAGLNSNVAIANKVTLIRWKDER